MNSNNLQKNRAFTLIELMIATSLFTIIMLMGVGSLVVSSNSAKSAGKLRVAVDNVNFAMESMTRELRTGSHYYCGGVMNDDFILDCGDGTYSDIITFNPQFVEGGVSRIGYFRDERKVNGESTDPKTYTLKRCESTADISSCPDIVSSNVNVETLKFFVKGTAYDDKIQPSVKILMSGYVKTKDGLIPFTLQSMASQRSAEQ